MSLQPTKVYFQNCKVDGEPEFQVNRTERNSVPAGAISVIHSLRHLPWQFMILHKPMSIQQ
jgi:hypothetical protein